MDRAMFSSTELMTQFERVGLALAIGFLVGVERGWKQREERDGERVAGLRTFALIGLLGGIAGVSLPFVGPIVLAASSLSFAAGFIAFELRRVGESKDNSATSVIAGLLVFCLGVYSAVGNMAIAAAAAVVTTALLAFKPGLHAWLKGLTWNEIWSALLILAASFIALPLLPHGPADPWGLIDLRHFWALVILVAVVSFSGYVALRALGTRAGLVVGALAGAIVSSTAVTLDLAKRVRAGEASARSAAAAASIASVVMLARVGILSATFSLDLFSGIWIPLTLAAATMLAGAVLWRRMPGKDPDMAEYRQLQSPLDIRSVARFAVLLFGMAVMAKIVVAQLGAGGLWAFASGAGLVDADAVTLAVGNLTRSGLNARDGAAAILLGVTANSLFKIGAAATIGGARFGFLFGLTSAASAVAGGLALLLNS